ncbi:hypothetical protein [Candidatus Caldatribacterium sp.]|uniref:hypothetical protein n=1 Tax=Candidatus Caldatribacterium sp. TaxID=2282143 RepID=UPI0029959C30|nr:hypothetical protein [Candidatus Caldatribacterium sp.]MDW8081858.1 hypothetical protein [Candidatus Calescibacterium sp.]
MLRSIWVLFLCGVLCAGCAWGEQPSWGETGKAVTFQVTCSGTLDPGLVYRIAIDTDGNVLTGPSDDPDDWKNMYILEWRNGVASLLSPDGKRTYLLESSFSGRVFEARVDLEALGHPEQMEVMVVVEDEEGNVVDSLQNFLTVRLRYQQSVSRSDEGGDALDPSGDILRVNVEVSL